MRAIALLSSVLILGVNAISAPASAQESFISNDPFDPFIGVLTLLPANSFTQSGVKQAQEIDMNLSTFRMRSSGKVEHYLKVDISYVLAAQFGMTDRIEASSAFYEGGGAADFEVIDSSQNCVPSGLCKATESLSVRFPFQTVQGGPIRIQFRDRNATWRGTVVVPSELFAHNLKQLRQIPK